MTSLLTLLTLLYVALILIGISKFILLREAVMLPVGMLFFLDNLSWFDKKVLLYGVKSVILRGFFTTGYSYPMKDIKQPYL
jgi:hypothetical protein